MDDYLQWQADIVKELDIILSGLESNVTAEVLLKDFAKRSHNENIQNFADVFSVANRTGGNIRQIVYETKNVINDKINVEQEIQTLISGKKNELNIMMVLPLIVVTQVNPCRRRIRPAICFLILLSVWQHWRCLRLPI